jgi:mannose-6-phosphate isomerase
MIKTGGQVRAGTVQVGATLKLRAPLRAQRTNAIDGLHEMATVPLYPLKFTPILRRLIWGGRRLGTVLHKPIGDASDYAESWEISDYRDAVSVVENGSLAGSTIRELIHWYGPGFLGQALGGRDQFPLLVKYIDAHQDLSVQVHPDDAKGRRLAGDSGKTETWVILQAEPGSLIYAGLSRGVGRSEFADAIRSGGVEPLLHRVEPKPGDCILIESGTVHAIGAGVLLTEIQQTSDATFRVYDWGRVGPDGKPRALHIDQALESIDFERGPVEPITPRIEPLPGGGNREQLSRSPYFALERLNLSQSTPVGRLDRFTILMSLAGSFDVQHRAETTRVEFGQTVLLPAELSLCEIIPRGGSQILTCVVPE